MGLELRIPVRRRVPHPDQPLLQEGRGDKAAPPAEALMGLSDRQLENRRKGPALGGPPQASLSLAQSLLSRRTEDRACQRRTPGGDLAGVLMPLS